MQEACIGCEEGINGFDVLGKCSLTYFPFDVFYFSDRKRFPQEGVVIFLQEKRGFFLVL